MRRRVVVGIVGIVSSVVLVGAAVASLGGSAPARVRADGQRGRGATAELQEQAESTQERLEALEAARQSGASGKTGVIRRAPATGWRGER